MLKRRDFLKTCTLGSFIVAGSAVAGAGLTSCSTQSSVTVHENPAGRVDVAGSAPVSFSQSVDVLIVGSGLAGFSAAIHPIEAGYSVLIVEKQSLLGGESFLSNGVFYVVGTELQKRAGQEFDLDKIWEERLKAQGTTWDERRRTYQKNLFDREPLWVDHVINEYGAQFADPTKHEGSPADILVPRSGLTDMASVMTPLRDSLVSKGLSTSTGLKATAFILNEESNVVGMRFSISQDNQVYDVQATTIIVATGGYSGNLELVAKNLPRVATLGCEQSCQHSMGEGLSLCATIGAALTDLDEEENLMSDIPSASAWGAFAPVLQLNPAGQRFAPEDDRFAAPNRCFSDELGYWWVVFDSQLSGSLQSAVVGRDTQANQHRLVGPCDTIETLADGMGVDRQTLLDTFAQYRDIVQRKDDVEERRTHFLIDITPPLYAMKLFPVRYRTLGGVQVDERGRILAKRDNQPIKNVFCCGSAAIGMYDGLSACAASGFLVGENVVSYLDSQRNQEGEGQA